MFECHSYRAKTRSLCTQEIVSRQPFLTDFMSWARTIRKEFDRQGLGSREGIQIVAGERGRLHLRVLSERIISGKKAVDASLEQAPKGSKMGPLAEISLSGSRHMFIQLGTPMWMQVPKVEVTCLAE